MRVWLITIGEPIPSDSENQRLLRTGILSRILAHRGNDVVWWNNRFDHNRKIHRPDQSEEQSVKGLRINLLESPGYKSNVSLKRVYDHIKLEHDFTEKVESEIVPDIILCSFPTIGLCNAAIKFGNKHKIPVLLDIRDLWPEHLVDSFPKLLRPLLNLLTLPIKWRADSVFKRANGIIGITRPILDWGVNKARRNRRNSDGVFPHGYIKYDYPVDMELISILRSKGNANRAFNLCFIGSVTDMFDFKTLKEALVVLTDLGLDCNLIVCGDGVAFHKIQDLFKEMDNVFLLGYVNASKLKTVMSVSSIGVVPYKNVGNFQNTISNKMIEYMAGGLPILSSISGFLGSFLKDNEIGYNYKDSDHLVKIVEVLYKNPMQLEIMSKNAFSLYNEKFEASKVYAKFATFLEEQV